jgi:hypothetical protein
MTIKREEYENTIDIERPSLILKKTIYWNLNKFNNFI